jgi:hypothetical protein
MTSVLKTVYAVVIKLAARYVYNALNFFPKCVDFLYIKLSYLLFPKNQKSLFSSVSAKFWNDGWVSTDLTDELFLT